MAYWQDEKLTGPVRPYIHSNTYGYNTLTGYNRDQFLDLIKLNGNNSDFTAVEFLRVSKIMNNLPDIHMEIGMGVRFNEIL